MAGAQKGPLAQERPGSISLLFCWCREGEDCRCVLILNKLLKMLDAQNLQNAGYGVLKYATSTRCAIILVSTSKNMPMEPQRNRTAYSERSRDSITCPRG